MRLSRVTQFYVPTKTEFLDYEQGVPHFKGFPGRVVKSSLPEALKTSDVIEK